MIGKIVTGKSFSGCLKYLHEGRRQETEELQKLEEAKKQAEVIHYNECFGTKKELIRQFIEVSQLNQKVGKPVFHASISFHPDDYGRLTRQDQIDIAQALAKEFDFADKQFVAITHADTGHEHMHVVANRIGYEGPTASDSNSYKRMAAWCRKMELQYQLTQVLSPNKFLKPEQRVAQSQRIDKRKERLKETLVWAIGKSGSVAEVKVQMEKQGYKVELGRGIAFIDEQMVRFKGSQVGYSLADIEKTLKAQQLISQQQQQQQIREQKRQEELAKEQTEQHRYSGGISR
ncbi:MAG: relaxase/mobilization nuclease domain-containing protein [Mucilaginibacter sp.]|jgi:hypothetical protein|uniref:relaxase/mobilization nuclease domain-containing protein n=1 Tax=Mucilaginibacter sp. TaxID=1882438 RepID=UPI0032660436